MLDGVDVPLAGLHLEVTKTTQAAGAYRWPVAWHGGWQGSDDPVVFTLLLSDRAVISNWVVRGFAMGIVRGTLDDGERVRSLYGLGELLI